MKTKQANISPVAAAAEAAGTSAPELAQLLSISEPAAWDVLAYSDELSMCLSLRQLLRLADRLSVSALSLLPDAPLAREHQSLTELASEVRAYCTTHHLSTEQFGDTAGWNVQQFLVAPDSALDNWCLDALIDVCHTSGLHWPNYFPNATGNA